jgi:phosphate transport system protein
MTISGTQGGQHISQTFENELAAIHHRVLEMGGLVEEQLKLSAKALINGDSEVARQVIDGDLRVNGLEVAIDEECVFILARRQPAASDLRLVMAVIKTITDLERMGDEAARIARMAATLANADLPSGLLPAFSNFSDMVAEQVRLSLDAFARSDVDRAMSTVKRDEAVDECYDAITQDIMAQMQAQPDMVPHGTELLWVARSLERIGDRACNICEYVVYLVKGKDVRHTAQGHDKLHQSSAGE